MRPHNPKLLPSGFQSLHSCNTSKTDQDRAQHQPYIASYYYCCTFQARRLWHFRITCASLGPLVFRYGRLHICHKFAEDISSWFIFAHDKPTWRFVPSIAFAVLSSAANLRRIAPNKLSKVTRRLTESHMAVNLEITYGRIQRALT